MHPSDAVPMHVPAHAHAHTLTRSRTHTAQPQRRGAAGRSAARRPQRSSATTAPSPLHAVHEPHRTAPHRTACAPRGRPAPPAALRHRHGPERGEKLRSGSPAGSSPCRSAGLTSISVTSNLSSGTRTAALRPLAGVSFGSVLVIPTRHKTLWQAECELHHQCLQQELAQ